MVIVLLNLHIYRTGCSNLLACRLLWTSIMILLAGRQWEEPADQPAGQRRLQFGHPTIDGLRDVKDMHTECLFSWWSKRLLASQLKRHGIIRAYYVKIVAYSHMWNTNGLLTSNLSQATYYEPNPPSNTYKKKYSWVACRVSSDLLTKYIKLSVTSNHAIFIRVTTEPNTQTTRKLKH